ncbi:hypothetical protein [Medusavirus stheno T3]|uniref:Uncharacterized protein n=1 Tax=Medusavirus stheno T3 TaxID=3069717 RepID=A0A7S8BEF4_9VIRU|nr:hypothetical protein QKU73_gp016 [Acanthamoeba castellanii medusavirus]QPB44197.1 hypothetical protein [Medusavirus stheno T3]
MAKRRVFRSSVAPPALAGTKLYPFVLTVYGLNGNIYTNRGFCNGLRGSGQFDGGCPDITGCHPCSLTCYGPGTTIYNDVGTIEFFELD